MRTTLTLDDDVAVQLESLRKERDASLKELVNEGLRHWLHEMKMPPKPRKPVTLRVFDMGEPLIKNLDNIGEVLALIEGEDHK